MPSILIVEDNDETQRQRARIFLAAGWDVRLVSTVANGLVALNPPPDCVIVDVVLPDGDGAAILEMIRTENIATRIVVVTIGLSDPIRLSRVPAFHPDLMIQKPLDWEVVWRYCRSPLTSG